MKTYFKFQILIALSFFWINQIAAQPGRGLNQGNMTQLYDSSTVETVTGKITKLDTVSSEYGRFPGILASLQIKERETKVYLAPMWYLTDQKVQFKTGESITVTGSRVTFQDNPLIISKTILLNKKEITLRSENGIPVWAGKRVGPGQGRRVRR
jgi:hypothetical protein